MALAARLLPTRPCWGLAPEFPEPHRARVSRLSTPTFATRHHQIVPNTCRKHFTTPRRHQLRRTLVTRLEDSIPEDLDCTTRQPTAPNTCYGTPP
jgi:hypothetical protein